MPNFPTTLDDNASLHVAKNNLYTTLSSQLLIGETTTMTVASTVGWDSSGYLSVDNEIIYYATTDATHFLTLTRARDNTSAAQHEVGAVVELRPVAMHHNDPKDAIVALETKVGVDSSAVITSLDYQLKSSSSVNPGHLHDTLQNLTLTGGADSTAKLSVVASDTTHVVDVDVISKKLKVNNELEFQTDSIISNSSGVLTIGSASAQTYFGPDGGATDHHIFLENGSIAERYTNSASAVAVGQAVYILAADTVALAKADAIATMPAIGVVVATPTTTSCFVSKICRIGGLSFASAGLNVYISTATAGSLQTSVPSGANAVVQKVGKSRSTTDLDINIDQQFLVLQ